MTANHAEQADMIRKALDWVHPGNSPDYAHHRLRALGALDSLVAALAQVERERDEWKATVEFHVDNTDEYFDKWRAAEQRADQAERERDEWKEAGLGYRNTFREQRGRLDAAVARAETLTQALRELSECVLNGWTDPAFVRGSLHERAVEIARAALAAATPNTEEK